MEKYLPYVLLAVVGYIAFTSHFGNEYLKNSGIGQLYEYEY